MAISVSVSVQYVSRWVSPRSYAVDPVQLLMSSGFDIFSSGRLLFVVVYLRSRVELLIANPKNYFTLHGGQSSLLSAEQVKEIQKENVGQRTANPPEKKKTIKNKKQKQNFIASLQYCRCWYGGEKKIYIYI